MENNYLLWCTLANSMHFTITVNISQSSTLISRIERKEVYFLNASTCLFMEIKRNESKLDKNASVNSYM